MEREQMFLDFYEWLMWSRNRKFYAQPPQLNILAQLQSGVSQELPEFKLSVRCNAFNTALEGLKPHLQHAFLVTYGRLNSRKKPFKVWADEIGVDRTTYARYALEASFKVNAEVIRLCNFYENARKEMDLRLSKI